jgi:hypothetical protein
MRKITITAGGKTATATLKDNATADAIWAALPLTAWGNRWGAEFYFDIRLRIPAASDAREVMEPGELGYWPPGSAFCIFWGPTPASQGDESRAASPVNPFGRLEGDPKAFDGLSSGEEIRLEKID